MRVRPDVPGYWQIAAGSSGRDYADAFLRYGMAFVGGEVQIATMARVKTGDRVLLKRGLSEVVAVGVVVQREGKANGNLDKPWLRDFDGWDLSAYCYVEWHVPAFPLQTKGLTRATVQRAGQVHLRDLAERTLRELPVQSGISPEPPPTQPVDDAEILEFLIREGLRPSAAEELTTAFRRIRLLARYYYQHCQWTDIREHETRTFLILPLLLALGWPEQQIKIELGASGKRVDVACFSRPYRRERSGRANDDDCVLVLESKGFSQGLDYAPEQAKAYATHFRNCRVVVVSNGYCYKAYPREAQGHFSLAPSAYLNLLCPQDRYPLDPVNVMGCLESLRVLLPSSVARP
jgi:hypothetical protein